MRALSVVLGFVAPGKLTTQLFGSRGAGLPHLYSRTFATWTTITCVLCVLTAQHPTDVPLYKATFASFLAAGGHFFTEMLFYKTMSLGDFLKPAVFACT